MRVIALDIHRSFAELAIHKDGLVRSAGRIMLEHDAVVRFAHVVLEATGNTAVIARLIAPHVILVHNYSAVISKP